ncbi:translocation/assembly module TamB [Moraxella caviae]|uniref:Translocation/assembly module TamB n=1 Tax=Moraxella caviae TaxID=34060 RepID=A0A1T0A2Z4_9GAMM|nr:translocation/assembly module TamB [Moraxella caviae]
MSDNHTEDAQHASPNIGSNTSLNTNPNGKPPKKRSRLLVYLLRFLITALVVLALIFVLLFYAVGTEGGTKFLLEKIALETGTQLKYSKGDLRRGVWVQDVAITQGEDIEVRVNRAYVQLGWRAVFARQVHLTSAQVDEVEVINHKPSTGEPFDYATIDLPVSLRLQDTSVKKVRYAQKGSEPVLLYDIHAKQALWSGTDVELTDAALTYDDNVKVQNATGKIALTGDYPLSAVADVSVKAINDVYFDTLKVKAHGTLKRTAGTFTSRYNEHNIRGEFVAQGLDAGAPFSAKLEFDEVVLPYATEQHITLKNGMITADGVIERIDLRINADLSAKDIPSGRYRGRGVVYHDGMDIPLLVADTPNGVLSARGSMSWADEYELDAVLSGDGFLVRNAMPAEYKDYEAYLPKTLTGDLGVRYFYLDKNTNETRFEFDLNQKDGEQIIATIAQPQDSGDAPWRIDASWRNLVRANVPDIERINSPHGKANIVLAEGRTHINATANIRELSAAPSGDYVVQANIEKGERIHLTDFSYQGEIGELDGTGVIDLASVSQPLRWQFDINTPKLIPNAYFGNPNETPIHTLAGRVVAHGRMRSGKEDTHEIWLDDTDLTATLDDGETVGFSGTGKALLRLQGGDVRHLDAALDGKVRQSYLSDVDIQNVKAHAVGDLSALQIRTLDVASNAGKAQVSGKLSLAQGVDWDLKANLDGIDTAKFAGSAAPSKISGALDTKGGYRDGKLHQVQAKFDGTVDNDKLPSGALVFDVSGHGTRLDITELHHSGEAGDLQAAGWFDISNGYAWDITAAMKNLNAGVFAKDLQSDLTGGLRTQGSWRNGSQKVQIDELNIQGVLNSQPFSATGTLEADLALPDDISAYLNSLKTRTPKNADELLAMRSRLDDGARRTQSIIRTLNAEHLNIRLGNNELAMNGTKHELTTSLNVSDLSQIIKDARGTIKGGVILMDDGRSLPTLYIDAAANGVRTANFIIQDARALGKIVNLGNSDSQLLLEAKNVILLGRVINAVRVDFSGTESQHTLALMTKNPDIEARAKVEGSLDRKTMRYHGIIGDGRMQTPFGVLSQRQPAEFGYSINDTSLQVAAHCWQTMSQNGTGSLCLQDTLNYTKNSGNVNLVVQDIDTSVFSPILPSDIQWYSTLNGKVQATWQNNANPSVNAVLYSDNGRIGLNQEDAGYVELPYERASIIAQSVPTGLKLRADVAGSAGRGYADVVLDPYKDGKPISGALVANEMNLAVLRPFFPELQALSGTANLAGGVGGTLTKPLFYGNASLSDGRLAIAGLPVNLNDINLTASIRGTNAVLDGGFMSGDGKGVLTGELDWQHKTQARVRISGEELDIASPPLLVAKVSPDVEVIVRPDERYVNVQGVLSVPSATIRPPEASATITTESPDVSVLDRRVSGNVEQILAVVEPWNINADIGLDLGSDVSFRGFGAKLPLAGALHITQQGQGAAQALGVVQVSQRTKIDGIGQNLELNYAQIRFNGDLLNPRLSIEAEKEVEGQTVGVRIKGTAEKPDITVFNDAGLTEQQAMSAIVTGRISESNDSQISEQGFRSQVTNSLAAAGLSLGLSGTRNLTNQIGRAFGLDSLTIDASGNSDDTNVNVTGYITPDLYIRYGVGVFNAESTLSMHYQLTRRIYIEAASGVERTVDVIYRWKF